MSSARLPYLTAKLQGFGTTIFAEMTALAMATGSVNLGQGFPDTDGPREVLDAAIAAINGGVNQYPPGPGMAVLREAIAAHQQRFYGLEYDPDSEVLVTTGRDRGARRRVARVARHRRRGGAVRADVRQLPGVHRAWPAPWPSRSRCGRPTTRFDPDELRAAITPKTKLLLINSPHNPTGHVLSRDELQLIADLAIEHDLIVITDEVYEHLVFDDAAAHRRWRRCPACASARW